MKRYFYKLGIFILGFIILIILPLLFVSAYDNKDPKQLNDPYIKSIKDSYRHNDLDVLFIGSSYCTYGIQSELLTKNGYNAYTMGFPKAGLQFYDIMIESYLSSGNQNPKTIFLLIAPMLFTNSSDDISDFPLHRFVNEPKSNLEVIRELKSFDKIRRLYNSSFRSGLKYLLNKEKALSVNEPQHTHRGFQAHPDTVTNFRNKKIEKFYFHLNNESFNEVRKTQLESLISELKEKNIHVVLLELPTYKLDHYFSETFINQYHSYLNDLRTKHPALIINMDGFTTYNFYDQSHLNTSGSEIATLRILEYIKNDKFVISHGN